MVVGPHYRVPFRRRREGKTNYKKRLGLIKSEKPRFVVRITNKHVIAQLIQALPDHDEVVISSSSKELVKHFNWKGDENNLPASYLVGLICGYKALTKGIKTAVPDIGLHAPTKGAKVFATLMGAKDAGLEIPIGEEVLPDEERLKGEHIAKYALLLKEKDPQRYEKQFSRYIVRGLKPEDLPQHFEETKKIIIKEFNSAKEG